MSEQNQNKPEQVLVKSEKGPTPNEIGGFYFSSSIKVFDPNTKEVMVQKRGDD